jgi:hypothetical protein
MADRNRRAKAPRSASGDAGGDVDGRRIRWQYPSGNSGVVIGRWLGCVVLGDDGMRHQRGAASWPLDAKDDHKGIAILLNEPAGVNGQRLEAGALSLMDPRGLYWDDDADEWLYVPTPEVPGLPSWAAEWFVEHPEWPPAEPLLDWARQVVGVASVGFETLYRILEHHGLADTGAELEVGPGEFRRVSAEQIRDRVREYVRPFNRDFERRSTGKRPAASEPNLWRIDDPLPRLTMPAVRKGS